MNNGFRSKKNFTIETDGIKMKSDKYDGTFENDIACGSFLLKKVTKFNLDILNGLKTYNPNFNFNEEINKDQEEIENPDKHRYSNNFTCFDKFIWLYVC